jgi:hypothetical protein
MEKTFLEWLAYLDAKKAFEMIKEQASKSFKIDFVKIVTKKDINFEDLLKVTLKDNGIITNPEVWYKLDGTKQII